MTRTLSCGGDRISSLARSARVELSDKTFFRFVTISRPGFSSEPLLVPLASAASLWLSNWPSEVAKASDAAAELLLSAERPFDATIANKKIRKAIIMVACFKIYIPPFFSISLLSYFKLSRKTEIH
jgi:hypothetical protein